MVTALPQMPQPFHICSLCFATGFISNSQTCLKYSECHLCPFALCVHFLTRSFPVAYHLCVCLLALRNRNCVTETTGIYCLRFEGWMSQKVVSADLVFWGCKDCHATPLLLLLVACGQSGCSLLAEASSSQSP